MFLLSAAPPTVTIYSESDGMVELFSNQTLICNADIITEVDVRVAVEIEWNMDIPSYFSYEGKHNISEISRNGFSYTSVMTISNFTLRESGYYICVVSVTPVNSSSKGGVSDMTAKTTEVIHIRTHGKNCTAIYN